MALKRKTPLRAKSGFKPSCGFRKKAPVQSADGEEKRPQKARERPGTARRGDRSSLETHLDIVFSLYVRLRDAMDGGRTRCISCGRVLPFAVMQCGHYFTRHNRSVRWDAENCFAQCPECNCTKSGNLEAYTPALVARIGQEAYDALCVRARQERKWSGEELRAMIRFYTAEVRRLGREKGISVRI